jgi:hypothetical protein
MDEKWIAKGLPGNKARQSKRDVAPQKRALGIGRDLPMRPSVLHNITL